MNDTLYEITRELVLLENYWESTPSGEEPQEQNGDDILELFRQSLDNLNMKFLDKVTNIVKFIKNLESFRDAVAAEAKRLSDRKRSFDNRIDWLKNYTKSCMEATQSEKIKYSLFTISVGKNQPSVEVVDIEKVDAQFIKIKKEVDKTKILEQMKATGVIPDGVNIIHGTHLIIR